MGAPVAWVLNLDADFELANRGPWEPPSALTELIEQISKHAERLMEPGDILVTEGVQVPPGTSGRAWCPTPTARIANTHWNRCSIWCSSIFSERKLRNSPMWCCPQPLGGKLTACA